MRGIAKRRYADVYNAAYANRNGLCRFVSSVLKDFEKQPLLNARAPRYLSVMLETQSIGRDVSVSVPLHSVQLSRFVENRAARCIARCVLRHLYKPGGWFVRTKDPFAKSQSG